MHPNEPQELDFTLDDIIREFSEPELEDILQEFGTEPEPIEEPEPVPAHVPEPAPQPEPVSATADTVRLEPLAREPAPQPKAPFPCTKRI